MAEDLIRTLLVDDQELVRSGLRRILRRKDGFDVIGECGDGDEVLDAVASYRPDVVVMDLRMKRVSGMDATRKLRETQSPPPVLALTTFRDDALLSEALRAGAAGFVLKDSSAEELIRAVRLVAAGEAVLDPAVTARVLDTYRAADSNNDAKGTPTPALSRLTARERTVLTALGRGLSNDEIAAELVISVVTVKSHISSIFAKLDVRDRAGAIVFAFDNGLVTPRAH
ncbi:putative two-component response regulator [Gordonia effusa NBRC 100432]|uniref:Putative two-component response regulator n=1 Tax=Gordonia effusa NBRC 100432 TaxID=1077974 RepID=H0QZ65_9ACTN|nr:response regulator transcription factor [Gordonia effusa]GAB18116.1 putative two-component response regulator [Gordonia effusa NBRC 100432]